MPITIKVDLDILLTKISELKQKLFIQQTELLDYKQFFQIEYNNDIKNMIKEIEYTQKILSKQIHKYKICKICKL